MLVAARGKATKLIQMESMNEVEETLDHGEHENKIKKKKRLRSPGEIDHMKRMR